MILRITDRKVDDNLRKEELRKIFADEQAIEEKMKFFIEKANNFRNRKNPKTHIDEKTEQVVDEILTNAETSPLMAPDLDIDRLLKLLEF